MGSGRVVPYGFGARGTSMLVNADLVLGGQRPSSLLKNLSQLQL
jgi:hypothetical protein